ncbi:MAG: hypothetical protein ACI9N1_000703 [Flavobacteriales bacterium]|jgi:hypothetical protein
MNKLFRIIFLINVLLLLAVSKTATGQDTTNANTIIDLSPEPLEFVFRPKLSVGIGMFTFYGDVSSNHSQYHPTVSRLAYELKLINPITDYLDLNFYALFGQVSANERTLTRNLNFNSNITSGGLTFTYNFKNFSDFSKTGVNPFISLGVESIEFLSKSDLQDANGNAYNYWEDGRIMNLDENDVNASSAFEIYRDYTYESDLRELDIDGYGKYSERSWAFPVEIGASFKVGTKMNFRVSTAMHFTITDLVDNVTAESIGNRAGTEGNDKFLYTSAAFTYDLTWEVGKDGDGFVDPYDGEWLDYYAQDTSDYDKDGVGDLADLCAKTPIDWQPVDERGCPLDGDKDGVPDNLDNELDSPEAAPVDSNGVAYTDEDYFLIYRMFKDSIGEFSSMTEVRKSTESEDGDPIFITVDRPTKSFTIIVGNDSTGVTQEQLYKLLGNPDFEVIDDGDQVTYRIGNFDNLQDVVNRLAELERAGLEGEVNVMEDADGNKIITKVDPKDLPEANGPSDGFGTVGENIYKVQIGAFSKKLTDKVFSDVSDLDYIKGEDGIWRYYSGTFEGKNEAARHRVDIIEDGYNGSFIVAFKSGKRLTLKEAGYDVNPTYNDTKVNSSEPTKNAINKDLIKFKVQVGAFANKIPTEILDMYLTIGNVIPKKDEQTGLSKYYIGTYSSYEEAAAMIKSLETQGIKDAFVVGDFNGKIITAQDALIILK